MSNVFVITGEASRLTGGKLILLMKTGFPSPTEKTGDWKAVHTSPKISTITAGHQPITIIMAAAVAIRQPQPVTMPLRQVPHTYIKLTAVKTPPRCTGQKPRIRSATI